jgi:hypothetical protein
VSESAQGGASAYEPRFGAFAYFPGNLEWSIQMIRLLSYRYVRGADFSRVHAVARSLPVSDNAAWEKGTPSWPSRSKPRLDRPQPADMR